MLNMLAVLLGATRVWRGRTTQVSNAASLKPALESINHQVLTLAVMMFVALMPAVCRASNNWLAAVLAVEGLFVLALFGFRARWRDRLRQQWESSVQASILLTLTPAAALHVMPAPIVLREAA